MPLSRELGWVWRAGDDQLLSEKVYGRRSQAAGMIQIQRIVAEAQDNVGRVT